MQIVYYCLQFTGKVRSYFLGKIRKKKNRQSLKGMNIPTTACLDLKITPQCNVNTARVCNSSNKIFIRVL